MQPPTAKVGMIRSGQFVAVLAVIGWCLDDKAFHRLAFSCEVVIFRLQFRGGLLGGSQRQLQGIGMVFDLRELLLPGAQPVVQLFGLGGGVAGGGLDGHSVSVAFQANGDQTSRLIWASICQWARSRRQAQRSAMSH